MCGMYCTQRWYLWVTIKETYKKKNKSNDAVFSLIVIQNKKIFKSLPYYLREMSCLYIKYRVFYINYR